MILDRGIDFVDIFFYGEIIEWQVGGFEVYWQFNVSVSFNMQVFGIMCFGQGWLWGICYVMKFSIFFGYIFDYINLDLGYFWEVRDLNIWDEFDIYFIFQGGIFGSLFIVGQQMSVGYSFNNIFEVKYFFKKDFMEEKLKFFDNIIVFGNYNFVVDFFKWSLVNILGIMWMFKGMIMVGLCVIFDFYWVNENGWWVDDLFWEIENCLLCFDQVIVCFNINLIVGKIRVLFQGDKEEEIYDVEVEFERQERGLQWVEEKDFLSLFENFCISYNFFFNWEGMLDGWDIFFIVINIINCSGSIQLMFNWFINIGNFGYDFVRKGIIYLLVGFQCDFYCWEVGVNWQLFWGIYSFYICVKFGLLDFLNIFYN